MLNSFSHEQVKDPAFFKNNRVEAHSDHKFYGREPFYLSLNGLWKFKYAKNIKSVIKGFERDDYDCRDWDDIRVPAHIQMEGYDAPQYVNVQYPWDGLEEIEPGQIPEDFNPVGCYVKYVSLHGDRKESANISFQGVESAFALWINGEYVGYSEDSFTPAEFYISPFLRDGINKIAVEVFKWSSSSWLEDQDFFRFSGIFRDVYIYFEPDVHIRDVALFPDLSGDFLKGIIKVELKVKGKGRIEASLKDNDKKEVASVKKKINPSEKTVFSLEVDKPNLWSAEKPN
ncbi:MAG: beta-galactosidase, partial [Lachnospiraceae bacterium]|nr:beta-galactosidase [Lachnospiraceae bacterium]